MASPTRSAQSSDNDNDDTSPPPSLLHALTTFLSPFFTPVYTVLDFLSSPAFLRITISALVFLLLSSLLLALSTTAYLIFYYNYIPPISLSIPLYLQYGITNNAPYALATIPSGTLAAQQHYEVSVELEVPRSPSNLETGVFMVDVRFLGGWDPLVEVPESLRELVGNITTGLGGGEGAYSVLQHARRPAMLRYRSWGLEKVWKCLRLPGHLLGWRDLDMERVRVVVWEGVVFKRGAGLPGKVRVEVARGGAVTGLGVAAVAREEERQVQVYKAGLEFRARFSGLRYLVYNHRIVSFVVFSTVFYVVSIVSLGLVWAWIGPSVMAPEPKAIVKRDPATQPVKAESQAAAIKTEDEDDEDTQGLKLEDVSDSPAQLPSGRGRPPLRFDGRPGEDDGTAPAEVEKEVGEGEKADDEEEDDNAEYDSARARTTGRFEGDSGIGTMSEGARGGHELTRRRSGRGLGGKQ